MSTNIAYSRALLRGVLETVEHLFPSLEVREAWVYKCGRDHWEFHGPRETGPQFYDGTITATNAYEARARGWEAYLRAKVAAE